MARVQTDNGCKVGWDTYDNEDEAKTAARAAKIEAKKVAAMGYDFGFQTPGEIWKFKTPDGRTLYRVTVP